MSMSTPGKTPGESDPISYRDRARGWLSRIARHLRGWVFAMARCRFSVIVLLAGLGLLMSDQGQDLLIAYADGGARQMFYVTFCATIWAFSIWGWARTLLDINFGNLPDCLRCYNVARRWLARLLGGLAFVVVGWSAYQGGGTDLALWAAGGFVVFLAFVWGRRKILDWMVSKAGNAKIPPLLRLAAKWLALILEPPKIDGKVVRMEGDEMPPYRDLKSALQLPHKLRRRREWGPRAWLAALLFALWLILLVMATVAPVSLGTHLGAMVLFFFWAATWLPVGSWLSYQADVRRIPLLTGLLLIAIFSSWTNDNHTIRFTEKPADVGTRPTVTEGLDAWSKRNASADGPVPFVVVATAGGGVRAAYWTGTVLGALHDDNPNFAKRLFAVSGVSGGSVGATVYRALLELDAKQYQEKCPDGMRRCTQHVLGQDLLGPVAAGLLFPDLIQRFWPCPWFPDRAAALEAGWEAAYGNVAGSDTLHERTVVGISRDMDKPALFLNATWIDNGRRIVASNLRFASAKEDEREAVAFERSNDQLAVLNRDLRLSTAAHNSARFPLVSPPGSWYENGIIQGRLQDGGLFENYGAETALEILDLACQKLNCVKDAQVKPDQCQPSPGGKTAVIPIVILISSDPSLDESLAESERNAPIGFAYEVRSTFRAYERTRGGRGKEAADRLRLWAEAHGRFAHFRMCPSQEKGAQPPLGWALSDSAKHRIESYLPTNGESAGCFKRNRCYYDQLRHLLSAPPPGTPHPSSPPVAGDCSG